MALKVKKKKPQPRESLAHLMKPMKPMARKGSRILDASMTSELKTDLSRHAVTPLEKLGVNLMYDKKQTGAKGKVIPVKNLVGKEGIYGDYHTVTGDVRYSVGHSAKWAGGSSRTLSTKKEVKTKPTAVYEKLAGKQADTLIHEGIHKAMGNLVGRTTLSSDDHKIISTINVQKAGTKKSDHVLNIPLQGNPQYKRNVSPAVSEHISGIGTRRFNIYARTGESIIGRQSEKSLNQDPRASGKWGLYKSVTKTYQDKASKRLQKFGLEDPSAFQDKSPELAKMAKRENALTKMRRVLQRQRNMLPMVTPRNAKFGTQEIKMDNQGHDVILPGGTVIPWEALKMDAEAKQATNSNASHFQRVTSNEPIQ